MDAQQTPQNTGVLVDGPYMVVADLAVQHARVIDAAADAIHNGADRFETGETLMRYVLGKEQYRDTPRDLGEGVP